MFDARELRQADYPTLALREFQSSAQHFQLELNRVGSASIVLSVRSVFDQHRVRDVFRPHPCKSRQQRPRRSLKSFHAPQSAHARIVKKQLDRLVDSGGAGQRTHAGLIDLPSQEPLRVALVGCPAALVDPVVADSISKLPLRRTGTFEDRAASAFSAHLVQLGNVRRQLPRLLAGRDDGQLALFARLCQFQHGTYERIVARGERRLNSGSSDTRLLGGRCGYIAFANQHAREFSALRAELSTVLAVGRSRFFGVPAVNQQVSAWPPANRKEVVFSLKVLLEFQRMMFRRSSLLAQLSEMAARIQQLEQQHAELRASVESDRQLRALVAQIVGAAQIAPVVGEAFEEFAQAMRARQPRGRAGAALASRIGERWHDGRFMAHADWEQIEREVAESAYMRSAAGGFARAATAVRATDGTFLPKAN